MVQAPRHNVIKLFTEVINYFFNELVLVPGRRPKAEMDSNQMSLSLIVLDDGILQCKHHLLRFRNEKKLAVFFLKVCGNLISTMAKKKIYRFLFLLLQVRFIFQM